MCLTDSTFGFYTLNHYNLSDKKGKKIYNRENMHWPDFLEGEGVGLLSGARGGGDFMGSSTAAGGGGVGEKSENNRKI